MTASGRMAHIPSGALTHYSATIPSRHLVQTPSGRSKIESSNDKPGTVSNQTALGWMCFQRANLGYGSGWTVQQRRHSEDLKH